MKKISTLFKKDPSDLGRVINEINPENEWVYTEDCIATRKFDGTAAAIINGNIYRRYDAKKGKAIPDGAIPCQQADLITGHHPHWVICQYGNSQDKYFLEAFEGLKNKEEGTYELIGEKVQGNPEKVTKGHVLVKHGCEIVYLHSYEFEYLKDFLYNRANDIEGIVFHNKKDGRMCKVRKSDFGVKR